MYAPGYAPGYGPGYAPGYGPGHAPAQGYGAPAQGVAQGPAQGAGPHGSAHYGSAHYGPAYGHAPAHGSAGSAAGGSPAAPWAIALPLDAHAHAHAADYDPHSPSWRQPVAASAGATAARQERSDRASPTSPTNQRRPSAVSPTGGFGPAPGALGLTGRSSPLGTRPSNPRLDAVQAAEQRMRRAQSVPNIEPAPVRAREEVLRGPSQDPFVTLEQLYQRSPVLTAQVRDAAAYNLRLTPEAVQNWFHERQLHDRGLVRWPSAATAAPASR